MIALDFLDSLNCSLNYIEEHLDDVINIKKAAEIACCSEYLYQRMFGVISGTSLGEYIRKRRLTLAAYDLQNSDISVMSASLKYGYTSPTAFTRAFSAMHGVSPKEAKKYGSALKAYPRISFHISIKGESVLDYRIEEKEAFNLVGIKETVINDGIINFQRIPQMWNEVYQNDTVWKIFKLSNGNPWGVMGAIVYNKDDTLDYYIAASTALEPPQGMVKLPINKGLWVVFPCIGRHTIQSTWKRIYGEWFPSSGFEHTGDAEIEWYSEEDPNADNYLTEIWIPIKRRKDNKI